MRKTTLYKKDGTILLGTLGLIFSITILAMMIREGNWDFALLLGIFLFVGLRMLLLTPHTVILQGNTVSEQGFFHKKTFRANEVEKIAVVKRRIDAGRGPRSHNYIEIHAGNGHVISFEYFYGKSPDVYEILQGWHKKHKSRNQAD